MGWIENNSCLIESASRNSATENINSSSLFPFPSSNFTTVLAETAILCAILFVWLRLRRKPEGFRLGQGESKIPFVSFFPVRVPDFMNGFYSLYRLKTDGLAFVQELFSKYGTFFKLPLRFGLGSLYCVTDPAIAQKLLTSTSPSHLNRPKEIYGVIFSGELINGLLRLEHDVWIKHRKVMAHSFNYSSLQGYLHVMNEHGKNLVDKLLSTGDVVQGKKVEELITLEATQIILKAAMGTDCCSDEECAVIHENVKRYKRITQHRLQNPLLVLHPIWSVHPNRAKLDRILSTARELLTSKIKACRQKNPKGCKVGVQRTEEATTENEQQSKDELPGDKTVQNCMIENMISSGASDLEIYAEILTMVVAGHETTANAITMLLFHLACNPECQALCREEVSKLWTDHGNLTMGNVSQLKYLERCIFEGLRLTPTFPIFVRRLDSPLEVGEKLTFEKGKAVLFSPWAIHHNSDIYPEPEKFDPDRFLPENTQKRHSYAYMPFSHGPRNCIGYKYAMLEMKLMLAWILHHFDVSSSVDPSSVKYLMEITLIPDRNLNIILRKRN